MSPPPHTPGSAVLAFESVKDLHSVGELFAIPLMVVDWESGRVRFANAAAAGMLGYGSEEIVGSRATDLYVDPEESTRLIRVLESEGVAHFSDLVLRGVEGRLVRVDGTMRVIHLEGRRAIAAGWVDTTAARTAEEAVRAQEANFNLIAKALPDGIAMVDAQGRLVQVNRRLLDLVGYDESELLGKPVEVLLPVGSRKAHVEMRAAYSRERMQVRGMGLGLDLHAIRKDGTSFPVDVALAPTSTPEGPATIAVVRDITTQREAEREFRVRNWAVESSRDPVILLNVEGHVTYANSAALRVWAANDGEDLLGRSFGDLLALSVAAESAVLKGGSWSGQLEVADGSTEEPRVMDVSISTVLDGQGALIGRMALLQDTTSRVRAHQALAESEARLRRGQEMAQMGYWEWRPDAREMWWSEQVAPMVGGDPGTGDGRMETLFGIHVHSEDRPRVADALGALRNSGDPMELEYRIIRPDGTVRWIRVQGEHQVGFVDAPLVGTVMDITQRRLLEDELRTAQRLESVGRLAAGTAHEFNNLMTAVVGHAQLLRESDPDNVELGEGIREIVRAAEKATQLTTELLTFADRQVVQPAPVDLSGLLREIETGMDAAVCADVDVSWEVPGDPVGVLLDPGQFRMVVTNLVHNACEASAGVGGTVSVVLRTRAPESGWDDAPGLAELTVRDTGTGMDEDTRAHIFDPFFTTKDTGKGVGLGMAGVYGAVTRSQGSIEVRSERGEGTVIEVRWPLCGECLDRRSGTS